ncbi:hypothetical protein HDU76_008143 [Blyttiomyces sp. JEL0837]|nr:hypothetical protein HDU76_008143 [Blyttiomyces sp. JEL0837]
MPITILGRCSHDDEDGYEDEDIMDQYRKHPQFMSFDKDAFLNVREISVAGMWRDLPDQVGESLFKSLVNLKKLDVATKEVDDELCVHTVLNNVSTSLVECILDVYDCNEVSLQFQGRQLDKVIKLQLTFATSILTEKFWTILKFFPNIKWLIITVKTSLNNEQVGKVLELCPRIETFLEYSTDLGIRRVVLPDSQQFLVTHLKGVWERQVTFPEAWYGRVKTVDLEERWGGIGLDMTQEERAVMIRLISLLESVEEFAWVTCQVDKEVAMVIARHCVQLRRLRFVWYNERPVACLAEILNVFLTSSNVRRLKCIQVDICDSNTLWFYGRDRDRDLSQAYSLAASRGLLLEINWLDFKRRGVINM